MYSQYKSFSQSKNSQSNLKKFLQDAQTEEICQMVLKTLNSSEVIKMLNYILKSFKGIEKCEDKRYKLVKRVFETIKKTQISSKHIEDIVNRIICDFSHYPKLHLTKLVEFFVSSVLDNNDDYKSWKDTLPVLLEILQDEKTISYKNALVSGHDYKISIIRRLCDVEWDAKILTPLAKMFTEITVDIKDKSVHESILNNFINKLDTVELNELPPLVHQLLKLCSDHNSTKLLSALSKYFSTHYDLVVEEDNQEDSIVSNRINLKELQEVESTVLYHIYESAQDNQKGLLEYMKNLKSIVNTPENILQPFVMSILLMLSGIYEDYALQILKLSILRQIQDEEHQNNSAWLRHITPKPKDFIQVIVFIISNSNKDRQLVFKGLVDLAFVLLDIERKPNTDTEIPWEYGKIIIQKVAKKRHDAGSTILECLIDRIVRGGSTVAQYTDCLAFVCKKLTMIVLDHQVWITKLLEQLLNIPGNAAMQVLSAVLPLMRISAPIRDNLIMILRKAIYRKGTQTRQMAVVGFIQLLINLKLTSLTTLSQSQPLTSSNAPSSSSILTQATLEGVTQRGSSNPWMNTTLCREILAILSKCFMHESEVRSHFYSELYYGVLKNSELGEYIIDILLEHLRKYYIANEEIILPLELEKCTTIQGTDVIIQEPIGELIFALQKMYIRVGSKESTIIEKLAQTLASLCNRMSKLDLEHLNIDEETDLLDPAPKAQQKLHNVKLIISVFDALIAYGIGSWSGSIDNVNYGRTILSLFKAQLRFVDFLKRVRPRKEGKGKKDKDKDKDKDDSTARRAGRPANIKLPISILDFDTISKTVVLLYKPDNPWASNDQVNLLKDRPEFHNFILQSCVQLLLNMKNMKDHEYSIFTEMNRNNFLTIGETIYKYILPDVRNIDEQTTSLALECMKEVCQLITTKYFVDLPKFLKMITELDAGIGLPLLIQGVNTYFEKIVKSLLQNAENNDTLVSPKTLLNILEILFKFINKFTFSQFKNEKIFAWLNETAENHDSIDSSLTSMILHIILTIEDKSIEYGEIIKDVCLDFKAELGTLDLLETSGAKKYRIINEYTLQEAYLLVNKILTTKLMNITWFLARLNAEYQCTIANINVDEENGENSVKNKEQSLCRQLTFVIGIFENLANVKISAGPASEAIFKNLQKVYTVASALTKYFRKKSSSNNAAFQSVKFIPVVQGAGSTLKQATQDLILHIESNQSIGKSKDTNVQRNKIMKEVSAIPPLVRILDVFDKDILLLSKKTGVDLMKYTKSDTIRDFRIKNTELLQNIEKMNVTLNPHTQQSNKNTRQETNNDDDSDQEEEEGSSRKRRRTQNT